MNGLTIRVLYGSETGTAQDVAEQIWKSAKRCCYCSFFFAIRFVNLYDINIQVKPFQFKICVNHEN